MDLFCFRLSYFDCSNLQTFPALCKVLTIFLTTLAFLVKDPSLPMQYFEMLSALVFGCTVCFKY